MLSDVKFPIYLCLYTEGKKGIGFFYIFSHHCQVILSITISFFPYYYLLYFYLTTTKKKEKKKMPYMLIFLLFEFTLEAFQVHSFPCVIIKALW